MLFKGFNEVESVVLDVVRVIFNHQSREAGPLAAEIYKAKSQDQLIVALFSSTQRIIEANQSFFDLFNLQPEMSVLDFREEILNQFLLSDLQIVEDSLYKIKEGEQVYMFLPLRLIRGDKFHRYHFFMTTMHEANGETKMVFIAWLDEVYASEQDDKTIAFDTADMNLSFDEDKQFSLTSVYPFFWDVNKGVAYVSIPNKIDGDETVKAFTIHEFVERLHPEDMHKIRLNKRTLVGETNLFTNPNIRSTELRIDFYDMGYRWFELRYKQNIKNAMGQILFGVLVDIDDRMRKFTQLQEQIEEQKKQDNHRRELLYDFAHQLRTPLESITQLSNDAGMCQTMDEMHVKVSSMQAYTTSLLHSLGELEKVLGLERQVEMTYFESLSVWEYMVELQQTCALRVPKGIRVLFTNPYEDIRLRLCKRLISQTIESILAVCMEQAKQGQIQLSYKLSGQSLILSLTVVSDHLVQIPKLTNKSPFEHNVKSAICKTLVGKMSGTLTEEHLSLSEYQYNIEIPVLEEVNEELVSASYTSKSSNVINQNLETILVAEDIAYNFLILKTLLEDRYHVVHAEDGQRVVELFEQVKPVFVFMDVKMPVLDGIEATRAIRKLSPTVPIVMLTAYAVRSLRRDAADAGANEMLTKPTTPKKINATLRKYLKK